MATVARFQRGFTFSASPSVLVRSQGWAQTTVQTPQSKNSNFKALLEVSYGQDMSLFMHNLRSFNFLVFNASRS